jgi:hypothetical protein
MAKTKNDNNLEMKVKGTTLTMTVDLDEDLGESNSGRSIIVARSERFEKVPDNEEFAVQLVVIKMKPRENKSKKDKD